MVNVSSLLLVLPMLFVLTYCTAVDEVSCANHVHRECKCRFNDIVDGGYKWNKNWCNNLQACAECLSIPRCNSKYLERFMLLLLSTLKLTKIRNVCPGIKFVKLMKRLQALGSKCKRKHGVFYDECGQQCSCDNGILSYCKRVRKEFTQMSFDERRRFVDAYYKATTDPYYKGAFDQLLNKHSEIPSEYLHHMPQIFFPWHRWHLLKIENLLRQIDCRVTIPYYQWTARVDDKTVWRTTHSEDVWHGGPAGLGGNGVAPSRCVKNGRFREGMWFMPISKGGGCLRRNFKFKCKQLYNQKKTDKLLKGSFKHFEKIIREEHHAAFHDCIGGNMPDNRVASTAPEYLFHHSFMDKLWHFFQKRGKEYKYAYYPSISFRMPFADIQGFQLLDNNHLPGGVSVGYEEMKKLRKRNGDGDDDDDETALEPDIKRKDGTELNPDTKKIDGTDPDLAQKNKVAIDEDSKQIDGTVPDLIRKKPQKLDVTDKDLIRKNKAVIGEDPEKIDHIDPEFEVDDKK